jgi:phage tail sheath protein FI
MAFQVSPGVQVREIDLTNVVPAVSTSIGATVVQAIWGPVEEIVTVSSEKELVDNFGTPTNDTAAYFFNAAAFLKYGNNLKVVRAVNSGALNAVSGSNGALASTTIVNAGTGFTAIPTITFSPTSTGATGTATLKAVGTPTVVAGGTGYAVNDEFTVSVGAGSSTRMKVTTIGSGGAVTAVEILEAGSYTSVTAVSLTGLTTTKVNGSGNNALTVTIALGISTVSVSGGFFGSAPTVVVSPSNSSEVTASINVTGYLIKNRTEYENQYAEGEGSNGTWAAKYAGAVGNSIKVTMCPADSTAWTAWAPTPNSPLTNAEDWKGLFTAAPGTSSYANAVGGSKDEMHILVIDEKGLITGVAGTILEKFAFLSQARDAKTFDGSTNYYKDVINLQSKYIWWMDHPSAFSKADSIAAGNTFVTGTAPITSSLSGGTDGGALDSGDIDTGFQVFNDAETIDVNLLIGAPTLGSSSALTEGTTQANNLLAIAENRKDVVAFVSPPVSLTTTVTSADVAKTNVLAFADTLTSSSYGFLDSTALKVYDKYNDVYRWIPGAGHMAGLCAKTDNVADAWFSPGGYTRGQLLGITKVAFNPNKAQRDDLYKKRVNPVVSFPGEGTILFGDKTLQAKPSAFDRINVRRLFIVLEKAIATAAKYQLFELNDEFTRAMFRNMTEPFLREIKGRRGITDFKVVCDATNNTGEIIDTNQFVADIYIKPARSINFINLNFIATRTGVNFSEIGG